MDAAARPGMAFPAIAGTQKTIFKILCYQYPLPVKVSSTVQRVEKLLTGKITVMKRNRIDGWIRTGISLLSRPTTRKGVVTLADQAVASATNFLTGVIIGRACTKEQFGLYMLGFSIVLFVMSLQNSLISTPYMVYSPRLKGNEHIRYTGSTLIHQLGLSGLIIIILVIGGGCSPLVSDPRASRRLCGRWLL